jgi:hypothetical protein
VGWTQANNGRLYHLGDLYGIYRSDDRGQTWTQTLKGFQSDEDWIGLGVAVVPTNANKVYYYGGERICRSLDGGETWPIYTTISREGLERKRGAEQLVLKPGTEDEIWAVGRVNATDKATVIRSTNGGSSFSAVGGSTFNSDFRKANTIHFRPTNPNHVWIGTSDGVYASTDGGSSWTLVAGTSGRSISAIGLSKVAGNNIAIVAASTWCRAINATDWNNVSTYFVSANVFDNGGKGSNGDLLALRNGDFLLSDSTRNVMRIGPTGNVISLISSTRNNPGGSQTPAWADMTKEIAKGDNWMREDIWQDVSQDNTIYSDGGAGPSISTDLGQTWTFICKGVRGVVTGKPVLIEGNTTLGLFPANDKGVLVHNNGGNSDTLVTVAKKDIDYEKLYVMHQVMPFGNGQTMYAVGGTQGLGSVEPVMLKSTNGGANWTKLAAAGLPASASKNYGNLIGAGTVDLNNSNDILVLMGNDFGTIHRSTDGGATFGPALGGIRSFSSAEQNFKSAFLERDGINANKRYCVIRDNDGFFTSDDKGATWTSRSRPFGYSEGFSVDPKTEGKLWIGSNYNLQTSNNGGINWTQVDNFQGVTSIDAFNGKVLIFARRNNAPSWDLWYSPDNGSSWQQLTNSTWRFPSTRNPDRVPRWKFTLDPNNANRFWVGGISGAVYTFTATGSTPAAPSITNNPSSVTVTAGNSATFSVAANGNPAPTFQWQRAANGSSTFSNLTAGGAYSGVTSGSLTVSNTTTTMSGDQFRAIATNSQGSVTSSAATLTVNQVASPSITSALTRSATVGTAISNYTITATNSPTSYNATSLPAGLSVNTSTGVISGTPTTAGTVNTTISATNAGGTGSATLVFTISAAPVSAPSITSALTASGTVGTAISNYTITATNSPTSYNATSLPAGLSVNTSTGVISGTPTTAGTFNTTISATNSGGTGSATLVFTIASSGGGGGGSAGLTREYWTGIGGTTIADLTSNAAYPNSPSGQGVISTMRATNWSNSAVSSDWADDYGQRIRGYITAPATGSYTFWISGDDNVELWLSTNDSAANRVRIAYHTDWTGVDEWNKYTTQRSAAISLVSGQRYYVEVLQKEGGGGDSLSVGWRKPSDGTGSAPAEIVPNSVLSTLNSTVSAPSITSALTKSGTVGTAISSYTITASNSPTSYNATSLPAGLSVNTSTGVISGTPTTAGTFNTTISATNSGGTGSATLVFTIASSGGGGGSAGLTREYWTGIGGSTIANLTSNAAYPNSPTGQDVISTMRATNWSNSAVSSNWADDYGQRIRGYITAPATGSYTFWISGDDNVELWLSTNDSAANRVRIAYHNGWTGVDQWTTYTTQKSAAISLVSGQRYYVEVLHKEGNGGDSLSVGWRKPSDGVGTVPAEIVPNSVLSTLNSTAGSAPSITSALTRSATVGTAISSYTITATNSPTSYNATNLPAGLSVNTSTGVISGTPTTAGTVNTTISATNASGTGSATLVFTIAASGGGGGGSALVYEAFNYTAGTSALSGANGGTGWGGAWGTNSHQVTSPGSTYSNGGNLSVAGLKATINANNSIARTLGATYSSGTYWIAFVINTKSASQEAGLYLTNAGSDRFFIGRRSNGAPYVIRSQINFNVGQTAVNSGTSALMVVKLVLGAGNDQAFFWVNPSLSGTPADAAASASVSDIGDLSFNGVKLSSTSFNDSMDIDEFRIGTSFQAVAPVQ